MDNIELIPLRSDHWEEETNRLLFRMGETGYRVRVLEANHVSDYEKWWERFAVRVVRLFNKHVITDYVQTFLSDGEARIYWTKGGLEKRNLRDHATLRHECVHVLQCANAVGGSSLTIWDTLLWYFLYTMVLPALWTLRAYYEKEAYEETIRTFLGAGQHEMVARALDYIETQFRGSGYFWMDVFKGGGFGVGGSVRRKLNSGELTPTNSRLREVGFLPRVATAPPELPAF